MAVLTVNINNEKDEEALNALKAIINTYNLDFDVEDEATGHLSAKDKQVISIPIAEWNDMQKRLNTERFYDEFKESIIAIKNDINGTAPQKNAREMLNGH